MTNKPDLEENELQIMYTDLNKACSSKDYDKIVKFSDKILKKYPDEFKAFQCKVVALMQLNNFEQALKNLVSRDEYIEELLFEKAYAEYRLNKLDAAIETIKSAPEDDIRMQELLAQIFYKQECYEESYKKYKHLIRNINDSYEDERTVNMVANITAMLQWQSKRKDFPKVPESMFEICLNKACYFAADGLYEQAIEKLNEAEEMCLSTFEGDDDVTQTEIDEELCAIKVQKAFCMQKLGQIQDANNCYHEILKKRCGEAHVLAIAANNVVCINRDQNIFDSRKKIRMATSNSAGMQLKLTSQQQLSISINHLLFLYYSNQVDLFKNLVSELLDKEKMIGSGGDLRCFVRALLIKSSQLVKEKQTTGAIDLLEDFLRSTNSDDVDDELLLRVYLTLGQLYLSQSSISRCQDTLARLPEQYLHSFGILSTRINLYLAMENNQAVLSCLQQALEYYKVDNNSGQYQYLLRISAALCNKLNLYKESATYYKALLDISPGDQSILASLIAAYSRYDKILAEKTSLQLKEDKSLPEIDVDSLESAFIFGAKHMKKLLKVGEATPGKSSAESNNVSGGLGSLKQKNRKKHKKVKLPKNMDSTKVPDPERWLPKRERSHFKSRKRDKRNNIFRGPQGATSGAGLELDASKKSSIPPTPSADTVKMSPTSAETSTASPGATGQSEQKSAVNNKPNFNKNKKPIKNNKNKKRR